MSCQYRSRRFRKQSAVCAQLASSSNISCALKIWQAIDFSYQFCLPFINTVRERRHKTIRADTRHSRGMMITNSLKCINSPSSLTQNSLFHSHSCQSWSKQLNMVALTHFSYKHERRTHSVADLRLENTKNE